VWKYLNYAVSDVDGVARFTKQSREKNAGFEGGSIRAKTANAGQEGAGARNRRVQEGNIQRQRRLEEAETEEVNMTTIDSYMRRFGGGARVDVMKIDTEGQDNKVGPSHTAASAELCSMSPEDAVACDLVCIAKCSYFCWHPCRCSQEPRRRLRAPGCSPSRAAAA
jgi:FkbM family methyltransferase